MFKIHSDRLFNNNGEMAVALSKEPNCPYSSIHNPLDAITNKYILNKQYNKVIELLEFCNPKAVRGCVIEWVDPHVDFKIEIEDEVEVLSFI